MQVTASRVVRLPLINITAMKSGAAQFEPALRLPYSHSANKKEDARDTEGGTDIYFMTTTLSPFSTSAKHMVRQSSMAGSLSPPRVTAPALANDTVSQTVHKKPWPYSLPRFLQPQPGTTYAQMHSDASTDDKDKPTTQDKEDGDQDKDAKPSKPVSTVQAVLYGIPEPKEYRYMGEVVREGEFLYKVLFGGGKEKDGEEGGKKDVTDAEEEGKGQVKKSKLKKSKIQLALEAESGEYENGEYLGWKYDREEKGRGGE